MSTFEDSSFDRAFSSHVFEFLALFGTEFDLVDLSAFSHSLQYQNLPNSVNSSTPESVDIIFERFKPFLEHVNWEELLQTAIESGMTLEPGGNQRFESWIHEFEFPIGLRGEHVLKVEVFLGDERLPPHIMHVYPIDHEGDDSWRKGLTDRYS